MSTPTLFVGEWKIDQNTSDVETRNDLARSVVIYVPTCSKENKAAQTARENKTFFMIFLPKKLNNLTRVLRTPGHSRVKLRDSVKLQRLALALTSGASGSKTSNACERHVESCKLGAEDWLVRRFRLSE